MLLRLGDACLQASTDVHLHVYSSALPLSYNSHQQPPLIPAVVVAGGSCRLVAEHWDRKPKALGSIPGSSTFLSCSFAISKVHRQ